MFKDLEFLRYMFGNCSVGRGSYEIIDCESRGWWSDEPVPEEVEPLGEVQQVEVYRRINTYEGSGGIRIEFRSIRGSK